MTMTMTSRRPSPPAAATASASGPSVQSARDYVNRVKSALGPASPRYRNFLDTLKGYRTRVISPQDVILRVSELFRGRDDLILGFNAFLPEEFRIRDTGGGTPVGLERAPRPPAPVIVDEEKDDDDDVESAEEEEQRPMPAEKAAASPDIKCRHSKPAEETWGDEEEEEEGEEDGARRDDRRREPSQDPQPRQKRRRVRVSSSRDAAGGIIGNIKRVGFAVAPKPPPPRRKIGPSTRILLAPPRPSPSDLLHAYDPIEDWEFADPAVATDRVNCGLCGGRRDARARARDEPVLLCEQRGCNAEFHLGCLYECRPSLFGNDRGGDGNEANKDGKDGGGRSGLAVPEGDIFCAACHSDGAAAVLDKYFNKVDYERSHYSCSRAYVHALLENHMRQHTDGNVIERSLAQEKAGIGEARLKRPPRSELWQAEESSRRASGKAPAGAPSAELLIGKPVRLYNNLDNEYHVGRIVDWRTCTVYPPLRGDGAGPPVSEDDTVHASDLEFYGTSLVSTAEYLVRFPSGPQGRRRAMLRWIVLEEHSLAVGLSLIRGRTPKSRGGTPSSGGVGGGWKPAMILARSALELVTVRRFLHEDEDGDLFADGSIRVGRNGRADDRWALASFFGEEQHALLNLREEARDLLADDSAVASNGTTVDDGPFPPRVGNVDSAGGGDDAETSKQADRGVGRPSKEGKDERITPVRRGRGLPADGDVPMGLALAELGEQRRCREWCRLVLEKSAHEHALVALDEYSAQSKVEGDGGTTVRTKAEAPSAGDVSAGGLRPLVERGMDRLWLARLSERVSSRQSPSRTSKDALMSFKCENVSSVSGAMASLNCCW